MFLLNIGLVFLLGSGEEISWGQRIFNLKTPHILKEVNIQREINIHNLEIFHGRDAEGREKLFWAKFLNIDRLFSLFWFSWCLLIPVVEKYSLTVSRWIKKINLPVVPIWLGIFFMVNYLISKIFELIFSLKFAHSIVEIKEFNIAFLFLLIGLYFIQKDKERI